MKRLPLMLVVASAVAACGLNAEALRAEKLATLDALRRETTANLYRQRGECQAIAVEFPGDRLMHDNCIESLRMQHDLAQITLADVDRRRAEIDRGGR